MSKYDIAIIGAGPAGIMAAIIASQNGRRIALIEKNPQIGRKLLSTGNGRCNLTNSHLSQDRFHGATPEFIHTILNQFDQHATMEFFENLGLILKEEDNGRIFPRTNQASSVVEVLKHRLSVKNVDVIPDTQVTAIKKASTWIISLNNGKTIESKKLIIATGGRAAHHLGSTGDGLHWAQKLGHSVTPIHAALVPVETVETWPRDIQGTKVEAGIRVTSDSLETGETIGDLLFTSYGVSGPAIMAQAGSIAPMLKTSRAIIHIDLFPDMTEKQLGQTVSKLLRNGKNIADSLIGLLPSSLIPIILKTAGLRERDRIDEIPRSKRLELVGIMKDLTLTVSKLRPLKEAQVTAGGLDTQEINPQSLESRLVKNLFFAGEIIDVDGDSGGFNLQWAWSSGHVAGRSAAE